MTTTKPHLNDPKTCTWCRDYHHGFSSVCDACQKAFDKPISEKIAKPRDFWACDGKLYTTEKDAELNSLKNIFKTVYPTHVIEASAFDKAVAALKESKECWDAAYFEGLPEAMNEARDGDCKKLLDLLDRRLLFAHAPIMYVLKEFGYE